MKAWMMAGGAVLAAGAAHGEVLLELAPTPSPAWAAVLDVASESRVAVGFTLPTGDPYTLDAVDLQLGPSFAEPDVSPMPVVSLFSDDDGKPDTPLSTLSGPASVGTATDLETFIPAVATQLAAGETYWIVVDNAALPPEDQSSIFWWLGPESGSFTGLASAASPAFLASSTGSVAWTPVAGGEIYSVAVRGTVVPEPAATALAMIGAAMLLRRRTA